MGSGERGPRGVPLAGGAGLQRLGVESVARGPRSRWEREERVTRRGGNRSAWAKLGRAERGKERAGGMQVQLGKRSGPTGEG